MSTKPQRPQKLDPSTIPGAEPTEKPKKNRMYNRGITLPKELDDQVFMYNKKLEMKLGRQVGISEVFRMAVEYYMANDIAEVSK